MKPYHMTIFIVLCLLWCNTTYSQEKRSGTKIYESLKNLDDKQARIEYNRHKRNARKAGFRPIITWLPQGASMNVGPIIVSEDRKYVRMSLSPFFSQIIGFKTFTFVK